MRDNTRLLVTNVIITTILACEIVFCACGAPVIAIVVSIVTAIAGVAIFITHPYSENTVMAISVVCHALMIIFSYVGYTIDPSLTPIAVIILGIFTATMQIGTSIACSQGRI